MGRYVSTVQLTQPDLVTLNHGRKHRQHLQRGQWVKLPSGQMARYVRHCRRGGLWAAQGNGLPYSINIEFTALVSKARLLEPGKSQLALI